MGNRDSSSLGPTDTIPKEKLERPCFYWVGEEQLHAWFHRHHPDRGITALPTACAMQGMKDWLPAQISWHLSKGESENHLYVAGKMED